MRFRSTLFLTFALATVALAAVPSTASAQKVIDLTVDMLDRWLTAHDREKSDLKGVETQLADQDAKIAKFEQCKRDFEAAGAASGSRLGGMAARLAIRKKCGASDADDMRKERQKIVDGPENAAAGAGRFKVEEYRNLKEKIQAWMGGDEFGFSKPGLDLLKSRRRQIASSFGVSADVAQAGGAGTRGLRGAAWTTDYAWVYISGLFAMQYLSGATMFEGNYKPGEWTKWSMKDADNEDEAQQTERAFLGKTAEGAEWWRLKTINSYKDGDDKQTADTVVLEALFKPDPSNEALQQLVRMRGRFPGQTEAQELMVPQQWGMWNMNGAFSMKPTKESIEGATVGTESVTTPAGKFAAKHVRFGQGGGTMDWWLDETTIGGWVKFTAFDNEKKPTYTMELIAKGTGAKSELGITIK
jgi:hypothetical protein